MWACARVRLYPARVCGCSLCLCACVCCLLPAICCLLPAACYLLPAACCLLPAACCRLLAACCLLFAVRCSLPAACCQPSVHVPACARCVRRWAATNPPLWQVPFADHTSALRWGGAGATAICEPGKPYKDCVLPFNATEAGGDLVLPKGST